MARTDRKPGSVANLRLRVLIVEDSEDDALLVLRELRDGGFEPEFERVETPEAMRAALAAKTWDAVTCDYVMPQFSALAALKLMRECGLDLPFIVVSGKIGEETAVEAMKAGARDYVMKTNLHRLASAVKRELRDAKVRRELEEVNTKVAHAYKEWLQAFDSVSDLVFLHDNDHRIMRANRAYAERAGLPFKEIIGKPYWEVFPRGNGPLLGCRETMERKGLGIEELNLESAEIFLSRTSPILDSTGAYLYSIHVMEDITERKRAEQQLMFKNAILSTQQETSLDGILVVDEGRHIISCNQRFIEMWGIAQDVVRPGSDELAVHSVVDKLSDPERFLASLDYVHTHRDEKYHDELRLKDGRTYEGYIAPMVGTDGRYYGNVFYFRDISERKAAEQSLRESAANLARNLRQTIETVALAIEKRDPYTAGHQHRVAELASAIAREIGLPGEQIEGLRLGATIHDIGKIYVPAEIMSRPGKIMPAEFEIIKAHPQIGYDIMKGVDFPWPVAQMILQHHERLDGSGYPQGLKGDAIIMEARILAVADVVEAMASHRPYRPGLGIEPALREVQDKRGVCFDAAVVDACVRLFHEKGYSLEQGPTGVSG